MTGTTDFVPFATDPAANVTNLAAYKAALTTLRGFQSGKASSSDANRALRQATFIAAALSQFIANTNGINVADDGNIANLVAEMTTAIVSAGGILGANNTFTGINKFTAQLAAPHINLGNLGANPALNFALGVNFTAVCTANFTLPAPTNALVGQAGEIELVQDATGSRLITYASGWIFPGAIRPALSTAAAAIDTLSYIVRPGGQIKATMNKAFA